MNSMYFHSNIFKVKMSRVRIYILASLVSTFLFTTVGYAGDSPEEIMRRIGEGDPAAGKIKSAFCQLCHGEDGNSDSPIYPKLAGQKASYIQRQIKNFKDGSRKDPVMKEMAETITDEQDLLDISAYFASQDQMKGNEPVVNEQGRWRFKAGNGCEVCHGANGKGTSKNPLAPVIGGQHQEYLLKQLRDFRDFFRTNDPSGMMPLIGEFIPDDGLVDVTTYESGL